MKTNKFIIATIVSLILLSSIFLVNVNAISDKTSFEVKSRMLTNDKIPIIVMLKDKSSFQMLSKGNDISLLKDRSANNQHNIAVLLNEEKKKDKVERIKQFWIVNAIAVNATPELIERLSAREDVESIGLDSQVYMIEEYYDQVSQGQIDNATTEIQRINATKAWEIGLDGTGINVSVIDTGIYATHPDISGRVIKWIDYVSSQSYPYDDNGHGTHVAGTVGGNGAGGTMTGVAVNASLFGAKVMDYHGNGYTSNIISAIEWSVDNKADIISLSLGGDRDQAMKDAIDNAISAGVTVIAAAGNSGPYAGSISFPAGEKNVIAVGAVDSSDNIAGFSSRGPITVDGEELIKPDISAPGICINSLSNSGGYASCWQGTSMATPHVSGTVALMIQNARIHNFILTPSQIINILANTSIDRGSVAKDNTFGWGRIDTYSATMYIGNDTEPPSVTANPAEYQALLAAKNGSIITLNVTISDNYGIKNASVNISTINNSLSYLNLSKSGGFWKANVTTEVVDGMYLLNVTAYDLSNNINNTTQIPIIVDNTPPDNITIFQVSYPRGNAAKLGGVIRINVSVADPIINGFSSGIKNVSVNASIINNTGLLALTNNSGFWKSNITIDKLAVDGNYSLNISFSDNANNINTSMQVNISFDNTPPLVNELSVSSPFINLTDPINITVNIASSDNVSQVNELELFARVIYPDGTSIDYNLSKGSGILFYNNFTDTAQYGLYNVTILANDTTGNTNSSQRTQFITTYMTNNEVNIFGEYVEAFSIAPFSNTSLQLNVNKSSDGIINIFRSKINLTSNALGVTNPGIYVFVNASPNIMNNLSYVILSVNYTDADVSSYVESSLRLYRWNISSSNWDKLSGSGSYPYVNDAGVDTVNNFVWANITHLSEFAVTGDIYVPTAPQSSGGGSGGGGGGGGASGENYSNIEIIEKYDLSIFKDKITSYRFSNSSNPIVFVNITGNVSFGEITASVEVLRNTSTMVKTEPTGIIYMNANIWVGSSSFNSPRNIKHGIIHFRVKNSWIKENNIASVRMAKWNKNDWDFLKTNEISKDVDFTYYDAFAQVFSNFAITGTKDVTNINEIQSVPLVEPKFAQKVPPEIEPVKKNPCFGLILGIICLWGVYISRRRRK